MNTEAYNKMMKEMAPGAFTAWWSMIQADAELAGEPIKPEAVVLHYMGNGASATVTASALDEVCRILAERATPAAASAGAAGTIDTPEFRALLNAFGLVWEDDNRSARNALIADIDQHTAAARKEGYDQGRYDESMAQGPSPAEWAKIDAERDSAGQAQATEGCCRHDSDCAVHNAPALPVGPCDCTVSERAATAPVSAAPLDLIVRDIAELDYSSDTVPDLLEVSEADLRAIIERHLGAPVSDSTATAMKLAIEWADQPADVCEWAARAAEHLQSMAISAAPVSADDQFCDANCTWLDHAPGCVRAEAAPVSAAEPFDHDQYITLGDRPMTPEQVHAALDHAQSVAAGQQLPTTYRQVAGWESARMEPDPAGEWVKRADLAMGKAQGELPSLLPDADVRRIFLANGFTIKEGHADLKQYVFDAAHAIMDELLARNGLAAKQAGKEGGA